MVHRYVHHETCSSFIADAAVNATNTKDASLITWVQIFHFLKLEIYYDKFIPFSVQLRYLIATEETYSYRQAHARENRQILWAKRIIWFMLMNPLHHKRMTKRTSIHHWKSIFRARQNNTPNQLPSTSPAKLQIDNKLSKVKRRLNFDNWLNYQQLFWNIEQY